MARYETQEERSNRELYFGAPPQENIEVSSHSAAAEYVRLSRLLKNTIARECEIDQGIRQAPTWSSRWWGRVKEADRLRGVRIDTERQLRAF